MAKNTTNKKESSAKEMTGAQVLLQSLQNQGIDLLVGYTGGAIMPTFDTLPQFPKMKFITAKHEQGAGFIAQGYTRACGKLAPVLVTSGPGATNVVTSLADAKMDSIPFMMVSGQVGTKLIGTDAFQETDVLGMCYPISKYALMPLHADQIAQDVAKLCYIATTGRPGPVVLDIPKDTQVQTTKNIPVKNPKEEKYLDLPGYKIAKNPNPEDIQKAVEIINSSKRPVALVGHGAIISDCGKELQKFLEKATIPAALTFHGLSSIPASHELNLGMMGMHGEVEANRAIQNADLLIALGMRFDDRVTGKIEEYAKNAKVIHIEIDPSEIHKNVPADCSILADLKEGIKALTEKIEVRTKKDRQEFMLEIEANKALSREYYKEIFERGVGKNGNLLMSRIIHELSEFTKGQDNIVTDVGQHQMFSAKFYKYEKFNSWFSSGGLGTMGFGLPAAIGVKLARPDEEVWAISGDGGFQMNIQELGTVLQEKLNINILLLNNSFLGMVKQWQNLFYKDNYVETNLTNPNFEKIAEAYGVAYRKVEKVEEIQEALEWSKKETRSTIVEFITDKKENVFPMIPTGWEFKDMIVNEEGAQKVIENLKK